MQVLVPIEDGLLDFMIGGLAYEEDRRRFWRNHSNQLSKLDIQDRHDVSASAGAAVDEQLKQQAHFDKWASKEGQTYSQYESSTFWRTMDAMVFDTWKREVKRGDWLLDVGCAQGRSSFDFMSSDFQIVGFDVSNALVRQAIQRYRSGNHIARATFFAADATRFPVQENRFNKVLFYGVLHHLPDVELACSEIATGPRSSRLILRT